MLGPQACKVLDDLLASLHAVRILYSHDHDKPDNVILVRFSLTFPLQATEVWNEEYESFPTPNYKKYKSSK